MKLMNTKFGRSTHALAIFAASGALFLTGVGCSGAAATSPVATTPVAQSCQNGVPQGMKGPFADAIASVSLRDEQKPVVERILQAMRTNMEPAHTAREQLRFALADSVMGGAIDHATIDPSLQALVRAKESARAAREEAINQLHACLDGPQRAQFADALVASMEGRRAKWREAHPNADKTPGDFMSKRLDEFATRVGLTREQLVAVHALMDKEKDATPDVNRAKHEERRAKMKQMIEAFKTDTFDAKQMHSDANAMGPHRNRAEKMVHFAQLVIPVLTPAQRTVWATQLREGHKRHGA